VLGPGGRIRSTLLTLTLVLTLTLALALTLTQAGESLVSRPPHKMASDLPCLTPQGRASRGAGVSAPRESP